jgi:hypothetical protein
METTIFGDFFPTVATLANRLNFAKRHSKETGSLRDPHSRHIRQNRSTQQSKDADKGRERMLDRAGEVGSMCLISGFRGATKCMQIDSKLGKSEPKGEYSQQQSSPH